MPDTASTGNSILILTVCIGEGTQVLKILSNFSRDSFWGINPN